MSGRPLGFLIQKLILSFVLFIGEFLYVNLALKVLWFRTSETFCLSSYKICVIQSKNVDHDVDDD